jgi:hypothetical protein
VIQLSGGISEGERPHARVPDIPPVTNHRLREVLTPGDPLRIFGFALDSGFDEARVVLGQPVVPVGEIERIGESPEEGPQTGSFLGRGFLQDLSPIPSDDRSR